MLAVLLLCVPTLLEPVERPIPFASLTPAQAASLEGKLRLYKVTLDSATGEWDGRVGYDVQHDDVPAVIGSDYPESGSQQQCHDGVRPLTAPPSL
jgi:hypothetical protein